MTRYLVHCGHVFVEIDLAAVVAAVGAEQASERRLGVFGLDVGWEVDTDGQTLTAVGTKRASVRRGGDRSRGILSLDCTGSVIVIRGG